MTRCKLNNKVEILFRLALSADWDPPCNNAAGNRSKGMLSESHAAADLINPVLDASEMGRVASICIPYIGAFFLMLLDLAEVIPAKLAGTPNGGGVEVG